MIGCSVLLHGAVYGCTQRIDTSPIGYLGDVLLTKGIWCICYSSTFFSNDFMFIRSKLFHLWRPKYCLTTVSRGRYKYALLMHIYTAKRSECTLCVCLMTAPVLPVKLCTNFQILNVVLITLRKFKRIPSDKISNPNGVWKEGLLNWPKTWNLEDCSYYCPD